MAKSGGKSSASSGTRKKHARKAGGGNQPDPIAKEKKPKGKDKGKNKEPRKKVYIPPTKPAPVQQDPLDSLGLARQLPPELLVVLRRLNKKDAVTKTKALEELQAHWVNRARSDEVVDALALMIPVWLHHFPALFLHRSRRIRMLTGELHASILKIPHLRDQVLFFLRETASDDQIESILGSWAMAARETDRQLSLPVRESWDRTISLLQSASDQKLALQGSALAALLSFVQRAVLDPAGVYAYLNPVQTSVSQPAPRRVHGRLVPVSQMKKDEDASDTAQKAEADEESESDRKARFRVGGLGVLHWLLDSLGNGENAKLPAGLSDILAYPALWSGLHHAAICPFVDIESFGFGQPIVRSATWLLLQTLLQRWKAEVEPMLKLLSTAVLRSAFVEPDAQVRSVMWQPLLIFLKSFPRAWELDVAFTPEKDDENESDSEDEHENGANHATDTPAPERRSQACQEFLRFLQLGASGSPTEGYPTVLIIVSTIPSSILTQSPSSSPYPFADFFTSFWAAIDGRALSSLGRAAASAAFLSSLLECMALIVRRLSGASSVALGLDADADPAAAARALVVDQYARVWDEIATKRLRVDASRAGALIAQNMAALRGVDQSLFEAAWGTMAPAVRASVENSSEGDRQSVLAILKALYDTGEVGGPVRVAAAAMVNEVAHTTVVASQDVLMGDDDARARQSISLLTDVVHAFGAVLLEDANLASALDNLVVQQSSNLLRISPAILTTYLSRRGDDERVLSLWRAMLSEVSARTETLYRVLPALLDAASRNVLPEHLSPAGQELDLIISKLFADATEAQTSEAQALLLRVVQRSKFFITYQSLETLLQLVISDFTETFDAIFHGQQAEVSKLVFSLELVTTCFNSHPEVSSNAALASSMMPLVYLLMELLPSSIDLGESRLISLAQSLAESWWAKAPEKSRLAVKKSIKSHLKEAIGDIGVLPGPHEIVQLATKSKPLLTISELLSDVLPSRQGLESSFLELRSEPAHPSLAITLPLIPPAEAFDIADETDGEFDRLGLSSYARVVLALLYTFMDDWQAAKQNLWAFKHLIVLSIYAEEFLQVPALPNLVFAPLVSRDLLREIAARVQQLSTYLLMSPAETGWHASVVEAAMDEKVSGPLDDVAIFISEFVKRGQDEDTYIESRVLHIVLQHILCDTDKDEGDQWMLLARKVEKQAPQLSLAIVLAVTQVGSEPPRLERYRNELAASALGVRASKANTEGLLLLRRLVATAPDPDSDIVFLPQSRAVNFLKACQQWIGSDEDIEEDLESEMTLAFFHLVPILQTVPGAHWDLIFDVIENNLENSSFEDDETLTILWRTAKLIQVFQDLVTYNKPLRASWKERETNILTLLRDLVAAKPGSVSDSKPRSVSREAALSIVQNLPVSLMDDETLSKMSHLLSDPSIDVQKMAYVLLREAANKRTEHVVIEAAVETESPMKPELPIELVQLLQQSIDWVYEGDYRPAFGYLLSWMVTFDLFSNASLKVRSGYTEHLRDLGLISSHLIPMMLTLLDLYFGSSKVFKLDLWAVDEFYIHSYEPEESFSCKVFAAHVYYRALNTIPSLVRAWLLDCKNRTLLTNVTNYTAQHFSPVIIGRELANVKSPEAAEELNVENLSVKVASKLNEVTVVYTVDEQNLELTLKIPIDWPLHGIEVKDSKRVGVTENRWRGWLLGVQQIVWSQNGHIVDALTLFKKNVTLHFEGQVECAICYSIISVMDGDLPRKPCKTCKNRFHASCLYKWFNTSHSPSCPLCRSDIL